MGVFVIRNADGYYLNRESLWSSAEPGSELFYSPHRDVALNQLLEVNAHDVLLRASVVECPADARGRPLIEETCTTDLNVDTDVDINDANAA